MPSAISSGVTLTSGPFGIGTTVAGAAGGVAGSGAGPAAGLGTAALAAAGAGAAVPVAGAGGLAAGAVAASGAGAGGGASLPQAASTTLSIIAHSGARMERSKQPMVDLRMNEPF